MRIMKWSRGIENLYFVFISENVLCIIRKLYIKLIGVGFFVKLDCIKRIFRIYGMILSSLVIIVKVKNL